MRQRFKNVTYGFIFVLCLLFASGCQDSIPRQIHLSVQGDAVTSVTITWVTMAQENTETHTVMYGRSPGEYMHVAAGISKKLPNKLFGFLHEVKLIGLEPNTTYYYVCGDEFGGFSEEHSFTTASEVGQDHTYERSFPIYAEQVVDSHPNEYDNPAGTIYVVTGGGGKSLYEIGSDYWTAYTESIYQHVKVDILQQDKAFHLQAISSDGDRIDEFWIYK